MTKAELHRLIDELPEEAVEGTSLFIRQVVRDEIDPDQAWVWTAEWQAQLRDSLSDIEHGRSERFESGDDFLRSL